MRNAFFITQNSCESNFWMSQIQSQKNFQRKNARISVCHGIKQHSSAIFSKFVLGIWPFSRICLQMERFCCYSCRFAFIIGHSSKCSNNSSTRPSVAMISDSSVNWCSWIFRPKSEWNCKFVLILTSTNIHWSVSVCSWFLDSAKIFSPFGMIQLTSSVICMAITIFNIDSVFFSLPLDSICLFNFTQKSTYLVLATRPHQFDNDNNHFIGLNKLVESSDLLLLWQIGIRKLRQNVRLCIFQFGLAQISDQITEIHPPYDHQYAETD